MQLRARFTLELAADTAAKLEALGHAYVVRTGKPWSRRAFIEDAITAALDALDALAAPTNTDPPAEGTGGSAEPQ